MHTKRSWSLNKHRNKSHANIRIQPQLSNNISVTLMSFLKAVVSLRQRLCMCICMDHVKNHCRSVVLKEQNEYSRGCSVIYMREWNFKEKHMLERGLIKIKNAINLGFYCWLDTILWFLNDSTWRELFVCGCKKWNAKLL